VAAVYTAEVKAELARLEEILNELYMYLPLSPIDDEQARLLEETLDIRYKLNWIYSSVTIRVSEKSAAESVASKLVSETADLHAALEHLSDENQQNLQAALKQSLIGHVELGIDRLKFANVDLNNRELLLTRLNDMRGVTMQLKGTMQAFTRQKENKQEIDREEIKAFYRENSLTVVVILPLIVDVVIQSWVTEPPINAINVALAPLVSVLHKVNDQVFPSTGKKDEYARQVIRLMCYDVIVKYISVLERGIVEEQTTTDQQDTITVQEQYSSISLEIDQLITTTNNENVKTQLEAASELIARLFAQAEIQPKSAFSWYSLTDKQRAEFTHQLVSLFDALNYTWREFPQTDKIALDTAVKKIQELMQTYSPENSYYGKETLSKLSAVLPEEEE
jgi:hypothetical protein